MRCEKRPFKANGPATLWSGTRSYGAPCRHTRGVSGTIVGGSRTCEDVTSNSRRGGRRIVRFSRPSVSLLYEVCEVMGNANYVRRGRNGSGGAWDGGVRRVVEAHYLSGGEGYSSYDRGGNGAVDSYASKVFWFGFRGGTSVRSSGCGRGGVA